MAINQEIGRIGQRRYGVSGYGSVFMEEFLPELQGPRGVQVYTEMSDNDETIGAILFAIENLMRKSEFHMEPGGNKDIDKEAAEFIESCMNDMERTWADTFSEIISFLPYGWSYHEIVYKRRCGKTKSPVTNSKYDDKLIGWRKLPIRSQDTLYGWEYAPNSDDLLGMTQLPAPDFNLCTIPLEKALHFRTRSRKDNPEGRSILRTAYRSWYFKKRIQEIEGYGMERDLAGFPVLYAPADMDIWDPDDPEMVRALRNAEMIVSSVRRDAREGLVLPGGYEAGTGWKFELVSSGGRRQFDTNAIIDRYDRRMATSVLADFVMLGQDSVGSFALADNKTKIFALAIGTYLDIICEVFNNQGIPRLIDLNGEHFKGITDYPKMVHGDIEDPDIEKFANFIEKMVGAGILVPDEQLEDEVRRVGHLPDKLETGTPREVQPGENGQYHNTMDEENSESKSIYKITSILEKYKRGTITREAAASLFSSLSLDDQQVEFYLKEADKVKESEGSDGQEVKKPPVKPQKAQKQVEKKDSIEIYQDDEEDAKRASEAKKSLNR